MSGRFKAGDVVKVDYGIEIETGTVIDGPDFYGKYAIWIHAGDRPRLGTPMEEWMTLIQGDES